MKKGTNVDKLHNNVMKLLSKEENKPLKRSDIIMRLGVTQRERVLFRRLLKDMVRDGEIVRVKGGRYLLPREEELITGILRGNRKGFGFVKPLDPDQPDMYIHRENMSTAMDGDTVLVKIVQDYKKRGFKESLGPEGRIAEVVKRANTKITGTLQSSGNIHYVVPDNLALFNDVYIDPRSLHGAGVGDKVICRITGWTSKHLNPEGKITRVIGDSRDFSTEIKAVIERFDLPKGFPRAAGEQVAGIQDGIPASEIRQREDYREWETFTIDPVDAKDFDDAVSLVYDEKNGLYELGVHIADVSHYVQQNTPLDREACRRGTSCYLINTVVPMLPTKLSNNLCSLKPEVARLTKSVIMKFTRDGELVEYDITNSVIKSKHRFTYEEVLEIIEGRNSSKYDEPLRMMADFSQVLRERRKERGSVTFDMPELDPVVSRNGDIERLERHHGDASHSLVEEFMLAANEVVASHIAKLKRPTIYRIHAIPDEERTGKFVDTAQHFGFKLPKNPTHRDIQKLLDRVDGKPVAYIINLAYLKTMKLAAYSTTNVGHFGLASDCYVHFTSPIRRYPDLIVHRTLDLISRRKKASGDGADPAKLERIAEDCSESERKADEAEKSLHETATLHYLHQLWKHRKIKVLTGLIADVNSMGMNVYIDDFMIEGILKMSSLVTDYFRVDKKARKLEGVRTRKTFRVGQEIRVRIKRVDLLAKELELSLAGR